MTKPGDNAKLSVTYNELVDALTEIGNTKTEVDEANGNHRSNIKKILTDAGWNKKALAQIRAIHDLSQTQRLDFLRTFKPMFECMLENKWGKELNDLLPDDEDKERAKDTAKAETEDA